LRYDGRHRFLAESVAKVARFYYRIDAIFGSVFIIIIIYATLLVVVVVVVTRWLLTYICLVQAAVRVC